MYGRHPESIRVDLAWVTGTGRGISGLDLSPAFSNQEALRWEDGMELVLGNIIYAGDSADLTGLDCRLV